MFALDIQDQILDKLNTLIVVLNNDGSIEYISKSAQQLLGYNSNDLMGSNWFEITRFSKKEGEQIKNKIITILKRKYSAQTFEHELKTASGGKKWVRWNVSFLNEDQIIGVGYDITEAKEKEKLLLEINKELIEKNDDLTASVQYAKRIQESILQPPEKLNQLFEQSFILYKPKDIVSGDYYWFYETERYKFVAAVDCTGHGVPGAMMSMVANSIFKEVFINKQLTSPSIILKGLDEELNKAVNTNQEANFNDGMDVSLIRIDKTTNELIYSGAFRNLLVLRDKEVIELKGSRYPIGFYSGIEKIFDETTFQLKKYDNLFLFTDGYIDQFGGERNKKLNKFNFKDLLLTIACMESDEQEAFLDYAFNNWKQDNPQTDDVLVIGITIQ